MIHARHVRTFFVMQLPLLLQLLLKLIAMPLGAFHLHHIISAQVCGLPACVPG